MSWVHPIAFLLLALVPALWFLPRKPRTLGEGVTRSLALLLLVLALARPVQLREEAAAYVAHVVDTTASTGNGAVSELVFPSGARATGISLSGDDSPLGPALARAAQSIPDGARGAVVVSSDGYSTDGEWSRAVQDLVARGLPVHRVDVGGRDGDLRPVGLAPLGELRVGQLGRVEVTLAGRADDVHVTLRGPDGELASADLSVAHVTRATLEFEPAAAGWLSVEVEVTGTDAAPGNEVLRATLAVQDPLRVLYLGQNTTGGAERLGELLGAGFDVSSGEGAPDELAQHDLVLLDDRAESQVDEGVQRDLVDAVTQGGLGLVMSGAGAFGPGGWHDTPVMDLMPVEAIQKEEKRDPSTTLVVIIDTSGSMGGNRVQLAKEVSRLAIQRLLPHDKVGIVEFFGAKRWAAPIQPASNRIELERALNRLNAGGGTVILPAIEEAFYGLQNVSSRYKHVLVLTDGGVERGSFESLIRRMADEGITVSTVLIGPDAHSEFLVSISNWGKGRFYSVPNRFNLPEILLKQPTSAKLPAWRSGEHVVRARGGRGWWGDVDPTQIPALGGYVETQARDGAQVLLETEKGGHPILATWRPGLGRTTALTTGPAGKGTEPWSEWEGYGAALGRILTRTASDLRMPYSWSAVRRGPEVTLTAERSLPGAPAPTARVDGGAQLTLTERAPGLFEARMIAAPAEEVRVIGAVSGAATRVLVPAPPAETQVDPTAALDLEALREATGGLVLTAGDDVPIAGGGAEVELVDRRLPLLLLALVAFLANVTLRRWPR